MPEKAKSIFENLNAIDVRDKIKDKNGLSYLSWASAWAEVKKEYPQANYEIHRQVMDEFGNTRFWHDDGKSGWVEVSVIINDEKLSEVLAIMDYRNKPISAESITSVDANKSLKRCLVKCCALHGLGLFIFDGEDIPESVLKAETLRAEVDELARKKAKQSDKAKEAVAELCKKAEKEANPELEDSLITGNYNNINDNDILEKLKKNLMAVRK